MAVIVCATGILGTGVLPARAAEVHSGTLEPGEEPATFAFVGDYGANPGSGTAADAVAHMIKSWSPDFIVTGGDNNYGGVAVGSPDWDGNIGFRFGEFLLGRADGRYPLQTSPEARFFPVVGNHDTSFGGLGGGTIEGYFDYFVDGGPNDAPLRLPTGDGRHDTAVSYYDFVQGDVHFVMADSDLGRINVAFAAAQRQWILERLQASSSRWKVLVMHHPPYSSDGVHGSQTWMQGQHLPFADLVLAAHAHVYERLEVDGLPLITCGVGGRSLYRLGNPLPETVFRTNAFYGALRVMFTSAGLRTEFRRIDDSVPEGVTLDTMTLGEFSPATNAMEFPFDAIAGQTLFADTSTGDGGNQLDPFLELVAPDGSVVASDGDGAGDGRNASIAHQATVSGRYRARISAESAEGGAFVVSVSHDPPLPASPWDIWRRQWFPEDEISSGPHADPDDDGGQNLVEYGAGTNPTLHEPGRAPLRIVTDGGKRNYLVLEAASGYRTDLAYRILGSATGRADAWQIIGERRVDGEWQWAAGVRASEFTPARSDSGEARAVRVAVGPGLLPNRVFRLQVDLAP